MTRQEQALLLFSKGYSCAQAVFTAFSDVAGVEHETALLISSGFGGGMGRLGKTCGAASGAVMVIGSVYGNDKETVYMKTRQFVEAFSAANGGSECRELLGIELLAAEKSTIAEKTRDVCSPAILSAVSLLEDMFLNK